jgi:hypothetical protein
MQADEEALAAEMNADRWNKALLNSPKREKEVSQSSASC